MELVFHERVGLDGRRISPFSWRVRYALAHKGIGAAIVPTRFADVDRISDLSGQHLVPIIEDDGRVIHDSWAIACHLEDRYPDAPSLFGGAIGRSAARLINIWSDTTMMPPLRRVLGADFLWCLDPGDRAYFRRSREAQFGATLEATGADREHWLAEFTQVTAPLERTLSEQPYLAGAAPAYVDYILFSVFQHARIGSPHDVLADTGDRASLRNWRARMVALHDGLGDCFAGYPTARSGPDGRNAAAAR
jgi:glutathione S-transferase